MEEASASASAAYVDLNSKKFSLATSNDHAVCFLKIGDTMALPVISSTGEIKGKNPEYTFLPKECAPGTTDKGCLNMDITVGLIYFVPNVPMERPGGKSSSKLTLKPGV